MRRNKGFFRNVDWLTILLYMLLVAMGWFAIYSADYREGETTAILDLSQTYGKQLVWIGVSLVAGMFLLLIDSKFYTTFAYLIYGVTLIALLLVLFFGVEIHGARSWIRVGGFAIQPAEFAKFATALAVAKYLSTLNVSLKRPISYLFVGLIIALPAILILLQGDAGSALVYGAFVLVLYREGLSPFFLILIAAVAILSYLALVVDNIYFLMAGLLVAALGLYYLIRKQRGAILAVIVAFILSAGYVFSVDYVVDNVLQPHQRDRILVYAGKKVDLAGAGYNVYQSKIAIGSGGLTGKGYLQGTQTKFDFVPEQETDFIFCTIGEEIGFVGTGVVLFLFFGLLLRIIFIAERQRSKFSRIYAYGVASIIFLHVLVNVGMTIGLAPVIGIPLPFFSYGGSSIVAFSILLFILLKLDSQRLSVLR